MQGAKAGPARQQYLLQGHADHRVDAVCTFTSKEIQTAVWELAKHTVSEGSSSKLLQVGCC